MRSLTAKRRGCLVEVPPRWKRYCAVVLVCAIGLCVASFAAAGYLSDDELITNGVNAYEDEDYIRALMYLYAYWERNPQSLQNDTVYKQELKEAIEYCVNYLTVQVAKQVAAETGGELSPRIANLLPAATPDLETPSTTATGGTSPISRVEIPGGDGFWEAVAVQRAKFTGWPTVASDAGSAEPNGGGYLLHAVGSRWVGPGQLIPVSIGGDFLLDMSFTIITGNSFSLSVTVADPGTEFSQFELVLTDNGYGVLSYQVYEAWVSHGRIVRHSLSTEGTLNMPELRGNVQGSSYALTFRREGAWVTAYINGTELAVFASDISGLGQIAVSAAGRTSIRLTSLEVRVR